MTDYTPTTADIAFAATGDERAAVTPEEFDRWFAEAKAILLRELAVEARTRGDIGHPEGVPADKWLFTKARLIEEGA